MGCFYMNNIDYDVNIAMQIAYQLINPYYSKYCAVHANSNENLNKLVKILDFKDRKVLLTGSSGDQYLTSVLNGSKEEIIYDINTLAKYYQFLKIGAIKALNYDEFIDFIVPKMKKYMDIDTIKKLVNYLPSDIIEFFEKFMNKVSTSKINNFIYCPNGESNLQNIKKGIPFYNREEYEKLKKIIENKEYPKFVNTDIAHIKSSELENEKFDIIYLSNIIECCIDDFSCECAIYGDDEWINFIEKVLKNFLSEDGEMLVDYKLHVHSDINDNKLFNYPVFEKHIIDSSNSRGKSAVLTYKPIKRR